MLWPEVKTTVLFDETKCVPPKDAEKYLMKAFPKGGILADEMGLGYIERNMKGKVKGGERRTEEKKEEGERDAKGEREGEEGRGVRGLGKY